jgi:hypothetical protein
MTMINLLLIRDVKIVKRAILQGEDIDDCTGKTTSLPLNGKLDCRVIRILAHLHYCKRDEGRITLNIPKIGFTFDNDTYR